eukprot:gene30678-37929_t
MSLASNKTSLDSLTLSKTSSTSSLRPTTTTSNNTLTNVDSISDTTLLMKNGGHISEITVQDPAASNLSVGMDIETSSEVEKVVDKSAIAIKNCHGCLQNLCIDKKTVLRCPLVLTENIYGDTSSSHHNFAPSPHDRAASSQEYYFGGYSLTSMNQ